MIGRRMKPKLIDLKTDLETFKNLEVSLGRVEDEFREEPVGPTPYPSIRDLRQWDRTLLKRYKPFYMPFCGICCLCTYGGCDLAAGKRDRSSRNGVTASNRRFKA